LSAPLAVGGFATSQQLVVVTGWSWLRIETGGGHL
jgi:hypothetical protein